MRWGRSIVCVGCGQTGENRGRGLCSICRDRARARGTLANWPAQLQRQPTDDVIEDYLFMAGDGTTRAEVAERLGMSTRTLERHIHRAKQAGLLQEAA